MFRQPIFAVEINANVGWANYSTARTVRPPTGHSTHSITLLQNKDIELYFSNPLSKRILLHREDERKFR